MKRNEFYFLSADKKTQIHVVEWIPEEKPKAILQIAHGVTEHILRYEEMAEFFTKRGFVVAGNDHLGHGTSVAAGAEPMYFGTEGSWSFAESDMYTCQKQLKKRYPGIPCIVLGLSLGSFLVRTYLIHHPGETAGVILAGTGQQSVLPLLIVRNIAKKEAHHAGEAYSTPLIKKFTFETYNKKFSPNRTDFDWLCSSEEGLEDYIADPLRGEALSAGLFREMLSGMIFTGNLKNQKKMDKKVPIFLVSGEDDPVGNCGKGVKAAYRSLQKAGVEDVSMKLYPGLRHDIFLEDSRKDIFEDIYSWIIKKSLNQ